MVKDGGSPESVSIGQLGGCFLVAEQSSILLWNEGCVKCEEARCDVESRRVTEVDKSVLYLR